MTYGLPYMGSKNAIAQWVLSHIPSAPVLVDIFAGGCALTHAALLSGRFGRVVANDITDSALFFRDAVAGKYEGAEERWVSREEFEMLKDSDPLVRTCWSFGTNLQDYLYSRESEPYFRAFHQGVFAQTPEERATAIVRLLSEGCASGDGAVKDRLQHLARVRRVQSLATLKPFADRLEAISGSYADCPLPDDCVIVADPPYAGTHGYASDGFDHEAFYRWASDCPHPLLICEYSMPDGFVCVDSIEKISSYCASSNSVKTVEKIFVPAVQWERNREILQPTVQTSFCFA